MKKKLWIPIIAVVVLLAILVIPVTATYDDGGTREYKALTYKVVEWNNRVTTDGEVVHGETKVYFFPDNFKSIDALRDMEMERAEHTFLATVLEMSDAGVLVRPSACSAEYSSSDKIWFGTKGLKRIGAEVGSVVQVTYTGGIMESYPAQIHAISWILSDDLPVDPVTDSKPVIYLYPEEETEVTVRLTLDGKLTCTYPAYNDGWTVTALPDGMLIDANGQTYNYLYWEGETYTPYDLSKGFCIKGKDTAAFLEDALDRLGLTRREANEFIVYWLPLMEENPYNVISFQTDVYTDSARLAVDPAPDTLIRVFMAWKASDGPVELPEQELGSPARSGFTVVEWGGTEIK